MSDNSFNIKLQAVLDKIKSIANIKADIKAIEGKLPKIKLQGTLLKSATRKELDEKLKTINPKVKIDADTTEAEKKIRKIGKQKTDPNITPKVDNTQAVSSLKQVQKETKTLWERFTNGIIGANLVRMSVQKVTQAIHQAISAVKELDKIKTDIQIASGVSNAEINSMMKSYNQMAKDLSSTTTDVGNAANEIVRMGESLSNTNKLIENSTMLAKIGMIDSSQATEYLISSMKGFQVSAENSTEIIDKLTSVDMEAAVSAGGLAEAMSRCANIANSSGTSMDRLIGYMAIVGEVTQDSMSVIGNAFKSMYSRMNNIKIGKFVDDETGESLSDTEAVLNKLGIQLRDTENTYRDFDDVLDDVGTRWKDFTKVEQNAISVAIAGTMQRERFIALMNNFSSALEYSEIAANSAGSALERYSVYQDSIEAKTNELTAAIESLSTNIISEELYSGIIEATTGLVEFLDKTNLLKASLAGLVAMGVSKAIVSIGTGFITAAKSTAQLTAAMSLFDKGRSVENLKDIGSACKGLTDRQLKLVLSTKGLTHGNRLLILAGKGVAEAEQEQTLTTLGFSAAEDKATVSTFSFKGALNSLMTAISMNPIGAIATAVSAVTIAFSVYKQHQEEIRQATEEAANAYKESAFSIDDYVSRYKELHEALIKAKGNEEETYNVKKQLLELQTELNDKFGDEYGRINLVTDAYKDQTEAIKAFNKETAKTYLNENQKGIKKATEEMTVERQYNLGGASNLDSNDKWMSLREVVLQYKDKGIDIVPSGYDGSLSIQLTADAESAYEIINEFESDLREKAKELGDEHLFDGIIDVSSSELNRAKETIDKYGDIYKQALMADMVSDDSKSETYNKALRAVEEYNEAVLRSEDSFNDEKVKNARQNLKEIQDEISSDDSWQKYGAIVEEVFEQVDTRLVDFNEKLQSDSGLQELADGLRGLDNIDLESLNPGENASFDKLKESAEECGLNVDELIDSLVRLGYVQKKVQSSTLNNDTSVTLSISQTIDQLNTQLKPSFDALKSAWQDIFTDDEFALNSINILSTCDSIKSKLDELNKIDGITVDYSAYEDFVRVLRNTESTEKDVNDATDALAASITQAALSGAEDFETMKAVLEDLGVVNSELVAFDALARNTEMLDEVLSQANISMDDFIVNAEEGSIEVTKAGQAFLEEKVGAENCAEALGILAFHKELCNLQEMNTAEEVANLLTLGKNAGYTGEVIEQLTELEKIYQDVASGTLTPGELDRKLARAAELETAIKESASNIKYEPKVDFSGATKSAKSAGKEAGKSYKDGLKEELSDLESVISGITKSIDNQISLINDEKDAALDAIGAQIDALEEERDARLAVIEAEKAQLEAQIKAIDKQIDTKQKEIDTINDAAEARQHEIDLQKAQYELERMQNQRTILQYSEDKGMHYVQDTKGLRDAKEDVNDAKRQLDIDAIEKEIDLLEEQKDLLNEQIDLLDEQTDNINKFYDAQVEALEKQKESTEKYFEMLVNSIEGSKSKYEELLEIVDKAELSGKLKKLGVDEEALLNGSEEEFEKLKNAYMNVVFQLNEGNEEVLSSLMKLSGYEGTAPTVLSDTSEKLDEMDKQLDDSIQSMDKLSGSATTASEGTSTIATNMGELSTNTEGLSENLDNISDSLSDFPEADNISNIAEAFTKMGEAVKGMADALGTGGEEATGLVGALQSLSDLSLSLGEMGENGKGTGILSQFQKLKDAVDAVTNAITGGGTSTSEDGDTANSSSPSMSVDATNQTGGGLTGAINSIQEATKTALSGGSGSAEDQETTTEGAGGAIGQFGLLKEAVDNVTETIGSEEEADENTLIGALHAQYDIASDILPKEKALFEELLNSIQACAEALSSMAGTLSSLPNIGSSSVESIPTHTEGTVGNAFAKGTGKYKGLPKDEKNALVSEYGQTEMTVLPNGKTIITDEPTMMDLPKDTVIFNEEQTKKIMSNRVDAKVVKSYANGTIEYSDGTIITPDGSVLRPLQEGDCGWELMKAFEPLVAKIQKGEEVFSNAMFEHQKQMEKWTKEITNNTAISNITNNRNVQPVVNHINVTCPGVTEQQVAERLGNVIGKELDKQFSGFHNYTDQMSRIR